MKKLTLGACAGFLMLFCSLIEAQDLTRYRQFTLGSSVATVTDLTATTPGDVRLVHQRPALIQELEWRPRYSWRGAETQTDPVDLIVFSFYNDQLFRVTVEYDRSKTEGLVAADLIGAISAEYGEPSRVEPGRAATAIPTGGSADVTLARWVSTESSITLVHTTSPVTFRLTARLTAPDNLARAAAAAAVRMDAEEAPQREAARRKKEAADAIQEVEKAKTDNKALFRP